MSPRLACSRRRAIGLLVGTAGLLPGLTWVLNPRAALAALDVPSRLGTRAIVELHLEHVERCGATCAARGAMIRPALLAAARQCERAPGPRAVRAAFALVEHFGEFPPVHGLSGGSQ